MQLTEALQFPRCLPLAGLPAEANLLASHAACLGVPLELIILESEVRDTTAISRPLTQTVTAETTHTLAG